MPRRYAYAAVICEVRVASTDRSVFSLWAEHSDLVKERFRGGAGCCINGYGKIAPRSRDQQPNGDLGRSV